MTSRTVSAVTGAMVQWKNGQMSVICKQGIEKGSDGHWFDKFGILGL